MTELAPHQQRYAERMAKGDPADANNAALTEYRWMLEEFRVSLFAQQLGTAIKVSPQRLEKQWAKV
jgi:ATP-dependent helicase HrpA